METYFRLGSLSTFSGFYQNNRSPTHRPTDHLPLTYRPTDLLLTYVEIEDQILNMTCIL